MRKIARIVVVVLIMALLIPCGSAFAASKKTSKRPYKDVKKYEVSTKENTDNYVGIKKGKKLGVIKKAFGTKNNGKFHPFRIATRKQGSKLIAATNRYLSIKDKRFFSKSDLTDDPATVQWFCDKLVFISNGAFGMNVEKYDEEADKNYAENKKLKRYLMMGYWWAFEKKFHLQKCRLVAQ